MATDPNFNKNSSQSQQMTRREALAGLALLPLLAIAPMSQIEAAKVMRNLDHGQDLPQTERQARPAPYPDPARTAVIDEWRAKFDANLIELERVWTLLGEARSTAPAEVDTTAFITALFEAYEHTWRFVAQFEKDTFETLITAISGRDSFPVFLEYYLASDGMSREDFEREFDHLAQTDPAEAARLRELAQKKWGTL